MIYIAFDEAHKERGNLSTNFKSLSSMLNENEFTCYPYAEFPIAKNNLAPFDILVFACPDNAKFSKQEIETIVNWVTNEGGGLLMLSHAGGDKGRRSNLSELAEQFGIIFENDQVLDNVNNMGVENLPVISNFGFPHPITEEVSSICYRAGCSLTISNMSVTPVVSSSADSEPVESPLILSTEMGEGIVAIGSYEMFRDNISGGFNEGSHAQLILNIFNWLKTSKRVEIRSEEGGATTQNGYQEGVITEGAALPLDNIGQNQASQYTTIPLKSYQSDVKIISNAELVNAFESMVTDFYSFKERMLKEFENFQNNLSNLVGVVIASEEDFANMSRPTPPDDSLNLSPPPSTGTNNNNHAIDTDEDLNISTPTDYSSRSKKSIELGIEKEKFQAEKQSKMEANLKLKKTKEEVDAEIESLRNKLNSIKNLTSFVEKKFSSGKLSKKNYDKQTTKLSSDLKETQNKIDELTQELRDM